MPRTAGPMLDQGGARTREDEEKRDIMGPKSSLQRVARGSWDSILNIVEAFGIQMHTWIRRNARADRRSSTKVCQIGRSLHHRHHPFAHLPARVRALHKHTNSRSHHEYKRSTLR